MQGPLLITDLDNTLYDWVTFFTTSFKEMIDGLKQILELPEEEILDEFKSVHQKYGNSEQPFAILELPSVKSKFTGLSRTQILTKLDQALHKFNSRRKRTLELYPGVVDTLTTLRLANVKIVGHTESILSNAYWRLRSLGIDSQFARLYTLEGKEAIHVSDGSRWIDPPEGFVVVVPRVERKPNPRLLIDICQREGVDPSSAFYVGDSLVRDIAMAKEAGVAAIWAKYGTIYNPACWEYLVKITHWTDEDVKREKDLKSKYGKITPDYTIDSFNKIITIISSVPTSAAASSK
jgi:FMN phosphatase YigB (HAD superfamily)